MMGRIVVTPGRGRCRDQQGAEAMWEMKILYEIGHWVFNNGFTILLFVLLAIIVARLTTISHQAYWIARGVENTAAVWQTMISSTNLIAKIDEANGHLYHIRNELEAINRREEWRVKLSRKSMGEL
jgi:hypothetical protein